jgi:glycosyltransferase involved in cell wall biosynthesis
MMEPAMDAPRVTTIIPTFRRARLLRRAISSVLEQDFPALQVCVYDNASDDDTRDVVMALANTDARVRYHRHAENIGGMANFQFGIGRVETPYFSFLSDDDYLLPGFYSEAVSALEACPEAMYWAGLTLRLDAEGRFYDARVDGWDRAGRFDPPAGALRLLGGNSPCWVGTLFRREAIARIGPLDDQVGGAIDLDYMLRLAAQFPYLVSKHPSAVYTMNQDSASQASPLSAFWPGWLKMVANIEAIPGLASATREQLVARLHEDARRMLFRRGARYLARGGYENARACGAALRKSYDGTSKDALLRLIASCCEGLPLVQRAYSALYNGYESHMVWKRRGLGGRYSGFTRQP